MFLNIIKRLWRCRKKRVNIYVGYDSRHGDFTDTSIKIMKQSIMRGPKGDVQAMSKWDLISNL